MNVSSESLWRVFCAVEMPEPVRELVLRHIKRLQEAAPDAHASWARAANLHLTLKFLGELPQMSVDDLSNSAARAVAEQSPFSVQLEHAGVFPNQRQPRVLWIGINDRSGRLAELQAQLEDEAAKADFPKESRRFHPHLTLARLRRPHHAQALANIHRQMEFEPVSIAVSELLVIRSELSSAGSKYTVVSRHPLI